MYESAVHDYYLGKLRQLRVERRQRLDGIRTRRAALAYQRRVKRAIRGAFGPRPERTPLNRQWSRSSWRKRLPYRPTL